MPKPIAALVVVLDKNLHPEQAEATKKALWSLKGVIGVCESYETPEEAVRETRAIVAGMRA